jgi:hypothetical protein
VNAHVMKALFTNSKKVHYYKKSLSLSSSGQPLH